jgi:predicted nuclease of predicted toxin-antitoxin system
VKLKLDENLPARLARILTQLGHETDTVPQEDLAGRKDDEIWAAAQVAGSFLITQDLDFSDLRRFAPGTHHGLLLLRLRAPGREALLRRVLALFQTEPVETWRRTFVVVTDHKLRVRRPRQPGDQEG